MLVVFIRMYLYVTRMSLAVLVWSFSHYRRPSTVKNTGGGEGDGRGDTG